MRSQNPNIDLFTHARVFNMMLSSAAIEYPSKENFIKDILPDCLAKNIITEEASMHSVWNKYGINMFDTKVELNNPFKLLRYDNEEPAPKAYWNYKFKKVMLPDDWKLRMGCSCGSNLNPSSFCLVDNNNVIIETLTYFNDMKNDKIINFF